MMSDDETLRKQRARSWREQIERLKQTKDTTEKDCKEQEKGQENESSESETTRSFIHRKMKRPPPQLES